MYLHAESEIVLQESDVDITIIPENPEPYQNVTIKLVSYATDLNKALIEWRSGSSTILSGYGKISYSFKVFGPNTTTIFDVKITPAGSFGSITKRVSISPSEIGLLWEAVDGYTPPFYKGKSFISRESRLKVVAIPNTNTIKSGTGNISYVWKSNYKTIQNASGYNKSSYVFKNDPLNKTEEITVIASSVDGKYTATKTIDIPIVSPKIIFYEKSPTEGILYNKALSENTFIKEGEMTIVAVPYFLAMEGKEGLFDYKWKINGKSVATPSTKNEITIKPSSRGGYAIIGFTMENIRELFQKVTGQLKLSL